MSELSTTYLGLKLRNPLVVASSELTATAKKIEACGRAGAGAIVLKSIFEQDVSRAARELTKDALSPSSRDVQEMLAGVGESYVLDDYLGLVEEAKHAASVPIIASLHCRDLRAWTTYARRIENVGADAIELNLFELVGDASRSGRDVEKNTIEVVRRVRREVQIPIAVKIGPHFSSLGEVIGKLREAGANGVVLFNRFYRADIDVEREKFQPAPIFSAEGEATLPLRWISLLSGQVDIDLCASTGIHDAVGAVKQLLVGARAVQLCTGLYLRGVEYIQVMLGEIESWMQRHKHLAIEDFRGTLSLERIRNPAEVERAQYTEATSQPR
jgi:dihydroorotate dehydrogenase (fumarate)